MAIIKFKKIKMFTALDYKHFKMGFRGGENLVMPNCIMTVSTSA